MRRRHPKIEINGIEAIGVNTPQRYDSPLLYTYDVNGAMAYARFRIDTATFVVDDFECTDYGFFAYSELPFDKIGFSLNKIIDKIC